MRIPGLRVALLLLAAWALVPSTSTAHAQDATRAWGDTNGKTKIALPAAWEVTAVTGADSVEVVLKIVVSAGAPEIKAWGAIPDGVQSARGALYAYLPKHLKDTAADAHTIVPGPPVHFWSKTTATNLRHLVTCSHAHRVPLMWVFQVPEALWATAYPVLLRAAAAGETSLEDWPARPAGYKPLPKDGFVYLLHPEAKEKDVASFHEIVRDAEAVFVREFGPIPDPDANPVEILFHSKLDHAIGLVPDEHWTQHGIGTDPKHGRMVGLKVLPKSATFRADVHAAVTRMLLARLSGGQPQWLADALPYEAWFAQACGKPLPVIPAGWDRSFAPIPARFSDLAAPQAKTTFESSLAYLVLFRCGDKKYQDAFAAFRDELRKSGDPAKAQAPLLALDQVLLLDDAATFVLKGLHPVEVK